MQPLPFPKRTQVRLLLGLGGGQVQFLRAEQRTEPFELLARKRTVQLRVPQSLQKLRERSIAIDLELTIGKPPLRTRPEAVAEFEEAAAGEELARVRRVHFHRDAHPSPSTKADGSALAA